MSELGDDFREWNEHKKRSRDKWRAKKLPGILDNVEEEVKRRGLEIKVFANGHRRIVLKNGYIDFWETMVVKPSWVSWEKSSYYGFKDIIKLLDQNDEAKE